MSGQKFPTTLPELRQLRGVLDQVITGMEILTGEQPFPPLSPSGTVSDVPAQRALPPASRVTPAKKLAPAAPVTFKFDHGELLLRTVKALGGSARKEQVVQATKLPERAVLTARDHLIAEGLLVVTGRARAARWSLSAPKPAKEAP